MRDTSLVGCQAFGETTLFLQAFKRLNYISLEKETGPHRCQTFGIQFEAPSSSSSPKTKHKKGWPPEEFTSDRVGWWTLQPSNEE